MSLRRHIRIIALVVLLISCQNPTQVDFDGSITSSSRENMNDSLQSPHSRYIPTEQESRSIGIGEADQDPYFTSTNSTYPPKGPSNITRNIFQDSKDNYWFATWEGIIGYDGTTFINYTNRDSLRRWRAFDIMEDRSGRIWFAMVGAGVYVHELDVEVEGGHTFTNLSSADGLVGDRALCLYQSSDGAIWIGTDSGLSRYDGESFQNYTTADGLPDMDINSIIEDKDGTLWIGARGHASRFDGETFSTIRREDGQPFINVRSLIKDKQGSIWLGGNDGLWEFNGSTFSKHMPNFVGYIYEDTAGDIWFACSSPDDTYTMSLYRYDMMSRRSPAVPPQMVRSERGQIFGIIEDVAGDIWYGHEQGVCRYDGETFDCFEKKESKQGR